jgi:hypothetical protein
VAALWAWAASHLAEVLLEHAIVCAQHENNAKSISDHLTFILEEE